MRCQIEVTDVVMMIIVGEVTTSKMLGRERCQMEVTTIKYYGEGGVRGRLPLVRCRGEVSNGGYH